MPVVLGHGVDDPPLALDSGNAPGDNPNECIRREAVVGNRDGKGHILVQQQRNGSWASLLARSNLAKPPPKPQFVRYTRSSASPASPDTAHCLVQLTFRSSGNDTPPAESAVS